MLAYYTPRWIRQELQEHSRQTFKKCSGAQILIVQGDFQGYLKPSGRIRFGVGRSWILVELWVGQICDATSKKEKNVLTF